jgi:hypothetical protein
MYISVEFYHGSLFDILPPKKAHGMDEMDPIRWEVARTAMSQSRFECNKNPTMSPMIMNQIIYHKISQIFCYHFYILHHSLIVFKQPPTTWASLTLFLLSFTRQCPTLGPERPTGATIGKDQGEGFSM